MDQQVKLGPMLGYPFKEPGYIPESCSGLKKNSEVPTTFLFPVINAACCLSLVLDGIG
jgi:hypothetical protein